MSLIMDALRRAQQLHLRDREVPPFLDPPQGLESTPPGRRRKKASLVLGIFGGLATILLIWAFFDPSGFFRREREKELGFSVPRERSVHVVSQEGRNPDALPFKPQRSEGKKEAPWAEGTEKTKRPQKRGTPLQAFERSPGTPSPRETPSKSHPKAESPQDESSADGKMSLDLCRPSPSLSADLHALFNQGVRHQNEEQIEKAIEAYSKVIERDPSYSEAYNNLGLLYQEQGDTKKAAEAFKKAIAIRPRYVKALNNLGILFYLEERYDEALDCFQRGLLAAPDHVESHLHLGLVLKKKGQFEKAIESFENGLRLNPRHAETHYNIALLLEELQRIDRAVEHYERFVQIAWRTHPALTASVESHLQALRRSKKE